MKPTLHLSGIKGILFEKHGFNVTCGYTLFVDMLGSGMRTEKKANPLKFSRRNGPN